MGYTSNNGTDWNGCGHDDRRVVLIKSLATNNRFYALVDAASPIRNADTIENIPGDLILGIAYPCLEDGLNDFAVIRTTFETIGYFADDPDMRTELMEIVSEDRYKLVLRLAELRDRIASRNAHFLGADLNDLKSYALDMMRKGYPRRNLDSMMKLDVFGAVAEHERNGGDPEPLYRYEPSGPEYSAEALGDIPPRAFVSHILSDILVSVSDDANYVDRYTFDVGVFQKFIALMFINYATTDPIFYGTNKADYGVSSDKDMDSTPLYRAVGQQIREIEQWLAHEAVGNGGTILEPAELALDAFVELPSTLVNEDTLIGPLTAICAAAQHLSDSADKETRQYAAAILSDVNHLVRELRRQGIVSHMAQDPAASRRVEPS
jgi:hypothetical protein